MSREEDNARRFRDQVRQIIKHMEAANKIASEMPSGWHGDIPNLQSACGLLLRITQGMVHDINTYFTAHRLDAEEEDVIDANVLPPPSGVS